MGWEAARQVRREKGMSCFEAPGCTGKRRERRRWKHRRGLRFTMCWRGRYCQKYLSRSPIVKCDFFTLPVLLARGGSVVDKVMLQGRRRRHIKWWKLMVEAVARRN